jgi:hypothetical protein
MSSNFEALQASPEVWRAHHVAYSVFMLGDIASSYDSAVDAGEFQRARCMLDAFYVHLRLIADFLVKQTSNMDFGPRDFGVSWSPLGTREAQALLQHWQVASTYVVHFGRPRVPDHPGDLEVFRIGENSFRFMATDALVVFRQFLNLVEARASAWSGAALIPDPDTDPDAWQLRIRADQASILRAAFDAAASQVGLK